ncbi:MAG TPA: hypothetical protein DEF43_12055 [Chloroflexus aurantiacus]|uniref:transposase n=1 Tax=Chloroflexus aurantiacus TaxID=1108 RepID=UPI000037BD3F|nr:transposase [Chloroflexus aurantiacus]HBW67870.1 hypothetical protein [Chloroflexus aurantiacus]
MWSTTDAPCRCAGWLLRAAKVFSPEATHCALLSQVQPLIPPGTSVTFLGDGEFDGIDLQEQLRQAHWHYVCRTASNILLSAGGDAFHVADLGPARGEVLALTPAWMTKKQYGPISIPAVWEQQYEQPIYLVTNMLDLDTALKSYRKRGHIETFFSDQKSRGFHIHKSHLSDPARLSRLLIAACLAYVWLVYLGVCALRDGWMQQLHRVHRCDLSLFRLGMRLLARCLKEYIPIPEGLIVPAILPAARIQTPNKKAA